MKYQLLILALYAVGIVFAVDVRYSELVADGAVTDFNMQLEYMDSNQKSYADYQTCPGLTDNCVGLTHDEGAEIRVSIARPDTINKVSTIDNGNVRLGDPTYFKIEACYEDSFTTNRKWRKPKDIISNDKRCIKEVVKKTTLPQGSESYTYSIKSDFPDARFFLTLLVYCQKTDANGLNPNGEDFCGLDTTGNLAQLAKEGDVQKRVAENVDVKTFIAGLDETTSPSVIFRTSTVDSRPTELIVSVIILSILAVSLLILYFVYERVIKKTA